MDMVATLESEGCQVVGPAANVAHAKILIEESKFDAALLDANLGGQASGEVAAALTRLDVPFVFVSGYGRDGLPEAFRQAPLIEKPHSRSQLMAILTHLLKRDAAIIPIRQRSVD